MQTNSYSLLLLLALKYSSYVTKIQAVYTCFNTCHSLLPTYLVIGYYYVINSDVCRATWAFYCQSFDSTSDASSLCISLSSATFSLEKLAIPDNNFREKNYHVTWCFFFCKSNTLASQSSVSTTWTKDLDFKLLSGSFDKSIWIECQCNE